ncbi:MAG TPA: DciA family protein [Pseudolabrys sp.]|nr:DciA family protein [Pseudolabrys sp.]
MSKPSRGFPRTLAELTGATLGDVLKSRGFASTEIVTRWSEIAGPDIAAHSEPIKINWPRQANGEPPDPATLVLRVEGPAALEIQHLSGLIIERVNRFFGWQAIGRIALRQAPLHRPEALTAPAGPDAAEQARIAAGLSGMADEKLKAALARLGAAVKRK